MEIIYSIQKPGESDYKELLAHLEAMDEYYTTRLSTRVDLENYAQKIVSKAYVFTARHNAQLIGIVAVYFNLSPLYSFCTDVSVLPEYQRTQRIGYSLLKKAILFAKGSQSAGFSLVADVSLVRFYTRLGLMVKESAFLSLQEEERYMQLDF